MAHTEAQIRRAIKPLLTVYGELNTSEVKSLLHTVLTFDAIHHIDMHMKLLNEETLLVGEFPLNVSDGPQIEMNIQYIQDNFTSVYGTPYKIVRIPEYQKILKII